MFIISKRTTKITEDHIRNVGIHYFSSEGRDILHQCHSKKNIIVEVLTVQNNVNFKPDQDDLPYADITCA